MTGPASHDAKIAAKPAQAKTQANGQLPQSSLWLYTRPPTAVAILLPVLLVIINPWQAQGQFQENTKASVPNRIRQAAAFDSQQNQKHQAYSIFEQQLKFRHSKWAARKMDAGISFAYAPESQTGQLEGDIQAGWRPGRANERRTRRSPSDSDDSDRSATAANGAGPVQSELLTILADTSDGAGVDLERVRASAKSLDAALLERLAGSGQRPLDYQVFYPRRVYSPAPPAPLPSPPSSASLGEGAPPDNAKTLSKRHSSSGSGSMSASATATGPKSTNSQAHYNRTNVVIKAFNYKLRLDLELNDILFGPNLVQKHFIPKGTHISAHQLDNCYYHAKGSTGTDPRSAQAIGAFRTCNGLSGIIHVNNESLVIHPFYNSDSSKKQPHIIYRYQTLGASSRLRSDNFGSNGDARSDDGNGSSSDGDGATDHNDGTVTIGECANSRAPNEWTMRQFGKAPAVVRRLIGQMADASAAHHPSRRHKRSSDSVITNKTSSAASSAPSGLEQQRQQHKLAKRDVGLVEKYIELGLVLSKDMFSKRNTSSRLEVLHDAIQVINCLDLYFRRSANTRVGIVYIETWAHGDQIDISSDVKQTLYNFLDYATRHLYGTSKDAVHLMTAGHAQQFDSNSFGMSIPDSICTTKAVSVSQESSVLEPFITAATIAHLIGHNLGMEHDEPQQEPAGPNSYRGGQQQAGRQEPISSGLTSAAEAKERFTPSLSAVAMASMAPTKQQQLQLPQLLLPPIGHSGVVGGTNFFTGSRVGAAKGGSFDEHDEDHEDEIKSRSLTLEQGGGGGGHSSSLQVQDVQFDMGYSERANDTNWALSLAWYDQDLDSDACQLNCIMNERFVYAHPPVAMGNMIQHQSQGATGPQVSLSSESTFRPVPTSGSGAGSAQGNKFALDYQYGQPVMTNESNQLLNFETTQQQQQQQAGGDQQQRTSPAPSLPFKFSKRSIDTYYALLREGRAYCLWNMPNKVESSIVPTCGNGIVERDEDCDCGSRSDCWSDTCCERLTCKFRKGVECISGACCDRCKFRPRGHVCRKSRGECDLPEQCDGRSYSCGPDLHKQNGYPCSNQSGYCFMGQCPLHDSQCVDLWGLNASSSEQLCYSSLNSNGSIFGNCGHLNPRGSNSNSKSSTGTGSSSRHGQLGSSRSHQRQSSSGDRDGYKRCEQDSVMCGTLQCQLGDMQPVTAELDPAHARHTSSSGSSSAVSNTVNSYQRFASNSAELAASSFSTSYEFSRKILRQSGKDYECKSITRPVFNQQLKSTTSGPGGKASSLAASSISYVRDGSKCGDQRVCFNQTCQPLERVYPDAFELCPRDERGQFCSAHGICSTANRCHCDEGWEGEDCSQAWFQQQQQPPTVPEAGAVGATADHSASVPADTASTRVSQLNSTQVVANSSGQHSTHQLAAADNSAPANYLNETAATVTPLGVTGMPGAALSKSLVTPVSEEPATTTSGSGADGATNLSEVTTPPPVAPAQPQQQQTTTSSVQKDKSKHDALGAHMLVFILVTMVAAVYLGFALMANCYRRKGFIKPDKVLRHHQLNCKMDALRTSFIAKRLALAETSGFVSTSLPLPPAGGAEIFGAFSGPVPAPLVDSPRANGYHQFNRAASSGADDDIALGHFAQQQVGQMSVGCPDNQEDGPQYVADQTAGRDIQATVHYFDHNQQTRPNQHNFTGLHAKQQQQQHQVHSPGTFGYNTTDAAVGSGDHIPLLSSGEQAEQYHHVQHHTHKPAPMRSFNPNTLVDRRHLYEQQQEHHHQQQQRRNQPVARGQFVAQSSQDRANYERQSEVGRGDHQQTHHLMNRAFSLGNVSRQHASQTGANSANQAAVGHHHYGHHHHKHHHNSHTGRQQVSGGPDMRHTAHAALATPSRGRVSVDANYRQRPKQQLDRDRASSIGYQLNMQLAALPISARSQAEPVHSVGFDSCSAPSSPEPHRHGEKIYWGGSGGGQPPVGQSRDDTCYHEGALADAISSTGRQQSVRVKNSTLGCQHSGDARVEREADMDDDEQDFDDDRAPLPASSDMSPSPPPPPPPAPPHLLPMLSSSGRRVQTADGDIDDDDDGDDDDDDEDDELVDRQGPGQTQQVAALNRQTSSQQLHKNMRAYAGQPPPFRATSGAGVLAGMGSRARYARQPGPYAGSMQENHLSLIGQLQQLEQVQSLHQKQVAAAAAAAAATVTAAATAATSGSTAAAAAVASDTGLHEFFSLPLSVQLSALLARNLAKSSSNLAAASEGDPADAHCPSPTSQIDEYLNTLNTSSVAMSSRRNFRGRGSTSATTMATAAIASSTTIASKPLQGEQQQQQQQQQQQHQPPPPLQQNQVSGNNSRNATMRKQQAKLQNLQSLIGRLQKLHNQTVMQQRFEADLVGGSGDDDRDADYYDDEGDDDDDDDGQPVSRNRVKHQPSSSRQSTLGRPSGRQTSSARTGTKTGTGPRSLADDDIFCQGAQPGATPIHSVDRHQQHQHNQHNQVEGASFVGGTRGRRVQHMRRSDSHRSRYETMSQGSSNKNELVYSMSDSEEGGGVYVSQMLARTSKYLRNQQPPARVSEVHLKAGGDDDPKAMRPAGAHERDDSIAKDNKAQDLAEREAPGPTEAVVSKNQHQQDDHGVGHEPDSQPPSAGQPQASDNVLQSEMAPNKDT